MRLNIQKIEQYNETISRYLDRVDIIGYTCARNSIVFNKELDNFNSFKSDLLNQYGHEDLDTNGNKTGSIVITPSDEHYEFAINEYKKVLNLDRNVDITKIKYPDVIGLLTGNEIVELSWMLED